MIWKMLADHARHRIAVVVEGDPDYDSTSRYREIGGDTLDDVSFDEYLRGWPGRTSREPAGGH